MLARLLPETIFSRKLPPDAERRLKLAQARAEEALIRAHVQSALMFVDALTEDVPFDRAIDTYVRVMAVPEPLASTVATRALVVLSQDLVPSRRNITEEMEASKPRVRLGESSDAGQRSIRRA
jgi:hypothetical protein